MIDYKLIIYTLVFIASAFLVHVLVWRLLQPKRQASLVLVIFIFAPLVIYLLSFANILSAGLDNKSIFFSMMLYLAIASAYVQTFPAFQATSPSLKIVYLLRKNGPMMLSEISGYFQKEVLVQDRLDDLLAEKVVCQKGDQLVLAFKGKMLASGFVFFRRMLGLGVGDG